MCSSKMTELWFPIQLLRDQIIPPATRLLYVCRDLQDFLISKIRQHTLHKQLPSCRMMLMSCGNSLHNNKQQSHTAVSNTPRPRTLALNAPVQALHERLLTLRYIAVGIAAHCQSSSRHGRSHTDSGAQGPIAYCSTTSTRRPAACCQL